MLTISVLTRPRRLTPHREAAIREMRRRGLDDPNKDHPLSKDPSIILDPYIKDVDEWQRNIITSKSDRMLILCHRQAGKSTAVAGLALTTAILQPGSLTILVSHAQRQSNELYDKVYNLYKLVIGISSLHPIPASVVENTTELELSNGSRIVSLPDSPDTIVGYSAPRLVVIDEAARTSDATFLAVSPMLLRSRGRLVLLSTFRGKRGFFYNAWNDLSVSWERVRFNASDNNKLDKKFLEDELRTHGESWYNQEYENIATDDYDQVFSSSVIDPAFSSLENPLFS